MTLQCDSDSVCRLSRRVPADGQQRGHRATSGHHTRPVRLPGRDPAQRHEILCHPPGQTQRTRTRRPRLLHHRQPQQCCDRCEIYNHAPSMFSSNLITRTSFSAGFFHYKKKRKCFSQSHNGVVMVWTFIRRTPTDCTRAPKPTGLCFPTTFAPSPTPNWRTLPWRGPRRLWWIPDRQSSRNWTRSARRIASWLVSVTPVPCPHVYHVRTQESPLRSWIQKKIRSSTIKQLNKSKQLTIFRSGRGGVSVISESPSL